MQYIIMCGGAYSSWKTPRQLLKIKGEPIVARTIRLLRENGVTDIAISSNDSRFSNLGVPVLLHYNNYFVKGYNNVTGHWCDCFYPTDKPVCYLMGDVIYSPKAIRTIVKTWVDDIEFFASAPPFGRDYIKEWAEPFAFKVANTQHFKSAIEQTKKLTAMKMFNRAPIAWELWQVIKGTKLNVIDYTNYTIINDYTCDVDEIEDLERICKICGI